MLDALAERMRQDPEKYRRIAISNLPKDISGEKNGNWKGGITARTRGIRFSRDYKLWRAGVLKRDGAKCQLCGSINKLQVHHIISMSECLAMAFLPMNGVVLCKDCHYKNDEAWQGKKFKAESFIGSPFALVYTIPHQFQAYNTVGNWQFLKDGTPVIFVSKMSDWRYDFLVAIHEFMEVMLCKHNGVTEQAVTDFDMGFKGEGEPGDDPSAPYRREHFWATTIERALAALLGVDWADYDRAVSQPAAGVAPRNSSVA